MGRLSGPSETECCHSVQLTMPVARLDLGGHAVERKGGRETRVCFPLRFQPKPLSACCEVETRAYPTGRVDFA
jgi:hypothetical protein